MHVIIIIITYLVVVVGIVGATVPVEICQVCTVSDEI